MEEGSQMESKTMSLEEKESMGQLFKETYFVFGKFDADGVPSDPLSSISVLQDSSQNCISHSTRTYRIDGELYYITLFKLEVPFVRATSKSDESLLQGAKQRVGILQFGDHPKTKEEDGLVQYLVIREAGYSGSFTSKVVTFNYTPCSLGSCFTYKGHNLPITNVHDKNLPDCFSMLREQEECVGSHLELKAWCSECVFQPSCVNHMEEGVDILFPGSNLADAYKLNITYNPSHGNVREEELSIEVCSVTVELIEVLKYIDLSTKSKPRVLWEANRDLHSETWPNKKLRLRTSKSGQSAKIALPLGFHRCYLRSVGPTFLTENLKRSYFIRFDVQVKHLRSTVKLTVVNPLYIVSENSGRWSDIHSKPESSYNHMLFLEKMPKPKLDPFFPGQESLQTFKAHGFKYYSHQMETFQSEDAQFSVTKVDFLPPHETNVRDEELISLEESSESTSTRISSLNSHNCRITCLVVKQSAAPGLCSSSPLYIGSFYEVGDRLAPCKLPIHGSNYSMDFHWKISFLEWASWLLVEGTMYDCLRLHLRTTGLDDFCPMNGAFVLVPEENLTDFLKISLKCPRNFRLRLNTWWRWSGFSVKKVDITLEEYNYRLRPYGVVRSNKTTTKVVTNECSLGSKDELDTSSWFSPGPNAVIDLPLDLYNVRIPPSQPTTYTNTFTRVHWLCVSVDIYLNSFGELTTLTAKVPVQIAADRDGLYRSLREASLAEIKGRIARSEMR